MPATEVAFLFVEFGVVLLALGVLARVAVRLGLSPIPFYLVAGLAVGPGGLVELSFSEDLVAVGAEIGVILLLFMLGLEYDADELRYGLRSSLPAGIVNIVLNLVPGVLVGLVLGWSFVAALLLGGITYNTSSGIVAKLLGDLDRLGNRETPAVLALLVFEDLTMAVYLPLVAILIVGGGVVAGMISLGVAVATVAVVFLLALRYGEAMSRLLSDRSDEVVLLTVFGLVLLVAGTAQQVQVSSAIGAFLVGLALSGGIADRARVLLGPLRDLFAATFFLFFSLQIDPASIPDVALLALLLAVITTLTKIATGWYAAARFGAQTRGRIRAGATLVARGEFSIVIAGLGVGAGVEAQLGALAAAYVLVMAVLGPLVTRVADPVGERVVRRAGSLGGE